MGGRSTSGFTLLELMLTLTVIAVIVGLAVPNFREFIQNSRLTGASNDLLASIQLARTEAIKRQRTVAMCATPDPTAAVPPCDVTFRGWVVWVDTNNDGVVGAAEQIVGRHDVLPAELRLISDGGGFISYQSNGFAQTDIAGTPTTTHVLICDERGELPPVNTTYRSKRAVVLSASGRGSVLRDTGEFALLLPGAVGTCP
ncbi:MAG TPA: GspH/FimT family pseudopilin [Steroidobacteraceae bacterium]|jgi:type IV fimbrial biogenesis protein FimT|nr:GspH/FimT family pseudopilin [Steroidobacteraceae bacterium]